MNTLEQIRHDFLSNSSVGKYNRIDRKGNKFMNRRFLFRTKIFAIFFVIANLLISITLTAQVEIRGDATTNVLRATISTIAIDKPSEVVEGDIMIANISQYKNTSSTAASLAGWTPIADAQTGVDRGWATLLYKIATGNEPDNYTFVIESGSTAASGAIIAFSGVNSVNPLDASTSFYVETPSTNVINPITAVTTISSNTAVILFGNCARTPTNTYTNEFTAYTVTSPSLLSELYDAGNSDATNNGTAVGASWALKSSIGTTGAGTITLSFSGGNTTRTQAGIIVALRPSKMFRSIASTAWSTLTTWQESTDGGANWVAATTKPTSGDVSVTIRNGHTVTLAAAETAPDLIIESGGTLSTGATDTWTLTVAGTTNVTGTLTLSNTGAKTFTGDVIINNGGVWNETGAAAINFAGSLQNDATTFTANSGTHTFSGTTKTLSGATTTSIANVAVTGSYTNNGTLTVGTALTGASGTLTNSGTLNIGGTCSIGTTSGGLSNSGTVSVTGSGNITTLVAGFTNTGTINLGGSGTIAGITNNAAGIVNLSSSGTIASFNNATSTSTLNISAATVPITTLTVTAAGNTVNYTRAGNQTVKLVAYSNLTLSGSGAKTIATAASGTLANGILNIDQSSGAATASITNTNIAVNQLKFTSNTQISGTWGYGPNTPPTYKNQTYFANTTGYLNVSSGCTAGTWSGATSTDWNIASNWCGGIPTSTTDVTIPSAPTSQPHIGSAGGLCRNITINNGASLTMDGAYSLTVSGNWSNSGSFTASTSTVTYDGAAQTVGAEVYNNLILSGSGTKTITGLSTVNGNFTMSGNNPTYAATTVKLSVGGNLTVNSGNTLYLLNTDPTLSVTGATSITGTVTSPGAAKDFTGDVTINSGGVWTEQASPVYSFAGSFTNNGTYTAGTGVYNFTGTSKTIGGSSTTTITTLRITGSYTAAGAIAATTLDNGGTSDVAAVLDLAGYTLSATSIDNTGATIKFSGASNGLAISTGTVEYYGTSQSITGGTYNKLTISGTGTKTINAGTGVTVNGTLANSTGASGFVIESASELATGIGSLISTNGVNATVQRYMTGIVSSARQWHLISSPMQAQGVRDFLDANQNVHRYGTTNLGYPLAPYNESDNTWTYYFDNTIYKDDVTYGTTIFTPGQGMQVFIQDPPYESTTYSGKLIFSGSLNSGDVSIPVTKISTQTKQGWNLVGNPYPSGLRVGDNHTDDFLTINSNLFNDIDEAYMAVYVGNVDTRQYTAKNFNHSWVLPPGQGFFIKYDGSPNPPSTASAKFTNVMRSHGLSEFKSGRVAWPKIELFAENTRGYGSAQVFYIPQMTRGVDKGYDAASFYSGSSSLLVYTDLIEGSDIDFEIQSLPDDDYENLVVPVGVNAALGSEVTFRANVTDIPAGIKVYLEDRAAGVFTRLDESGSNYTVLMTEAVNGTGRFYLHTKQGITGIPETLTELFKVIPLPQEQMIRLTGPLTQPARAILFDLNGRMVATEPLMNPGINEIPVIGLKNGIYLLQIQAGNSRYNRKISWIN